MRARLNGSVPGEHNDGPFRLTPSLPFLEELTAARRTELTSSPRYGGGRENGNPLPNPPTTSNRPAVASVTDVWNVAVALLPKPTFYRLLLSGQPITSPDFFVQNDG